MENVSIVGIDLAKRSVQLHGAAACTGLPLMALSCSAKNCRALGLLRS